MNKKLDMILRYSIFVLIFLILLKIKDLGLISYSVYLALIILDQLLRFMDRSKLMRASLIFLEILIMIYLVDCSIYILFILSSLIVLNISEYLDGSLGLIFHILVLTLAGYYIYLDRSLESLVIFILSYIYSLNLAYYYSKKGYVLSLEKEVDSLKYQEEISQMEAEKKDAILKDIYITRERNRISRDMHDTIGHSLSTIIIQLSAIEKLAQLDGQKTERMIHKLRNYALESMDNIRAVLKDTKPKNSDEDELILMIENLIKTNSNLTDMEISFKFSSNRYPLDYKLEKLFYNAVKEFISNSIKHSQASRISINLFYKDNLTILSMKDNGQGTDSIVPGMGLKSLEERVRENHGDLLVESSRGSGFFVSISIER